MRVFRFKAATALASASIFMASAAFAQDAPLKPADDAGSDPEIVVTGTLISNPNLKASSPISVIGADEIQLRQNNSAEQLLREVPGIVPSLGSNVNNGNNGTSLVDLRGLGTNRNIVLLDGARIVPADFGGSVDLNNIPIALVERVDVLTGGASTTYGADAISGVVNFITKRDFAGLDAQVSEQITEEGDGNTFRADVTLGANFDDGRGNVVLGVGYQEADAIFQGDRPISIFGINSRTGVAAGSSFTSVPVGISNDIGDFQLNPAGNQLVPFYQGFNFNPFNIFQTPFERFNIYGAGHYEVSDKIEVYTRALFSKNTVSTIIAPSGIFGNPLTIPGNNPFLPAGVRDQLCGFANIPLGATCNTNAAIPLPAVYRRTVEVGPRISTYVTQVFDIQAGARIKLTDSLKLNIYGSHGESENTQTLSGYVLNSRVQQALNATNPNSCIDASNSCVPLNLFGPAGSISSAQAGFLNGTSTVTNKSSISQVNAVLSGDFGFSSPAASEPVAFAIGGEYRDYGAQRIPDILSLVPGELGGAGGAILPLDGGLDVKEAFGELIAPIASDRPLLHELTLEAGVRYSKYKVDTAGSPKFNATTYKFGGTYAPVEAVRFRANYQRAVRAPNIGELFRPVVTGLTNLLVDPCAGNAPVGNANLAAICLAQGAPASAVAGGTIQNPSAGQANSTGGGNPLLRPETGKTYTAGVIVRPQDLIPGLTITLDYYNIKISKAIAFATPADVIAACFGSITAASAASTACTSIRRNPANGRLSGTSTPTVPILGLPQPLTNAGRQKTDGIDLTINYKRDLGFADLDFNFQGNYTNSSEFAASSTSFNRDCVGFYSANCSGGGAFPGSIQPKYSFTQRTTLGFDTVDVSLFWRFIDSVKYEGQAKDFAARGFTAANRSLFSGTITGPSPLAGQKVNFNRIKSFSYFDLTTRVNVSDNLDLTLSAFNIFDKKPPVVGSAAGNTSFNSGNTFPSTYDAIGRRYAATARFKF